MGYLRRGELVATGLPKSGYPPAIPAAVWIREGFYLNFQLGDLVEIDENSEGEYDRFLKRWTAIMLELPATSSATTQPATIGKQKPERRRKSDHVAEVIAKLDLDPSWGPKAIASRIAGELPFAVQSESEHAALTKMVERILHHKETRA